MAFDQLTAIGTEANAFWAAFAGADSLDVSVPSCPDWDVADLGWHLAEVHWFWASIVEQRITDVAAVEVLEQAKPQRPDGRAGLAAFGRAQANRLLEVLDDADPSEHVWSWTAQQDVAFVRRHQVQEAAIHRWDMQSATGAPGPIDGEIASDALDELLTVTLPALRNWDAVTAATGSVHLHCTDVAGEWIVRPGGQVEREHAKGDAAIRGTASDLLLVTVDRLSLEAVDVVGDRAVAESFVHGFTMD